LSAIVVYGCQGLLHALSCDISLVATSADSVPSSKTNIFQSKLYTLIYCRHFRTYSWCAMFDWSDTVFRWRNVTRRRTLNTVNRQTAGDSASLPQYCTTVFDMRLRVKFLRRKTVSLQSNIAHREQVLKWWQ
jgi:hypothetical protein